MNVNTARESLKLLRKGDWPNRKLVAFTCWCVRHTPLADGRKTWDLLDDPRSRRAVETAERWLGGLGRLEEVEAANEAASFPYDDGVDARDARVIAARAAATAAYLVTAAPDKGAAAAEQTALALAHLAGTLAAQDSARALGPHAAYEAAFNAAAQCHAEHLLAAAKLSPCTALPLDSRERNQPHQASGGQTVPDRIRVHALNGVIAGAIWEATRLLRAGRMPDSEMVLDHWSVSGRHAELCHTAQGWYVRDMGSTHGTFVNGMRIGSEQWPLRPHDVVKFGDVEVRIEFGQAAPVQEEARPEWLQVMAMVNSWANTRAGEPSPGQVALSLRNVHPTGQSLHEILGQILQTMDADSGVVLLADGPEGTLRLRSLNRGSGQLLQDVYFSHSLTQWCFTNGRSVLCWWHSVVAGTNIYQVSSALCILLRTQQPLGVLFLVRPPLRQPFAEEDLHAADALAELVSADIEKKHRPFSAGA